MPLETTLYTRVGDDGYTGVLGRERVAKYDLQPVAYGTLDEASALLGLARTSVKHTCSNDILLEVQRDLPGLTYQEYYGGGGWRSGKSC